MNELLVKDRIDELMKALNLSQADFARRVGVTRVRLTWPLIVWLNMWQVAVNTAISCLEAVRIV